MTGTLALVGLGPGSKEHLTVRAVEVLQACDAVIGYTAYVDLVAAWFPSETRRWVRGKLGQEHARATEAIHLAQDGLRVALVSTQSDVGWPRDCTRAGFDRWDGNLGLLRGAGHQLGPRGRR